MAFLTTGHTIYLISFHGRSEQFIFNSVADQLGMLIHLHGKDGIEFIKQFQPHKGTFKKLSKKDVYNWFNWDTYSLKKLREVNFIKL